MGDSMAYDLAVWGIIVLFMIIGLVLLTKILRSYFGTKVQELKQETMTFDDLGRMQQTGLLTEEEAKIIKQRMAEKLLGQQKSPTVELKGEEALKSLLHEIELKGPEAVIEKPQETSAAMDQPKLALEPIQETPATPNPEATKAHVAPSAKTSKQLFDLEKLLTSGAIDEAEYQRLKEYFKKQAQ